MIDMIGSWAAAKMIQNMTQNFYDKQAEPFTRASGLSICEHCGKDYFHHPKGGPLGYDNKPFCRRLCDGSLVKL